MLFKIPIKKMLVHNFKTNSEISWMDEMYMHWICIEISFI